MARRRVLHNTHSWLKCDATSQFRHVSPLINPMIFDIDRVVDQLLPQNRFQQPSKLLREPAQQVEGCEIKDLRSTVSVSQAR